MIVTLIMQNKISSITLPDKKSGQFWLNDNGVDIVAIEGIDNNWIVKPAKNIKLITDGDDKNVLLETVKIYKFESFNGKKYFLYSEYVTDDRRTFQKFVVKNNSKFEIGRDDSCDIIISNDLVSSFHATITYQNEHWSVVDRKSRNYTFVNGNRVINEKVNYGDVVYIMGVKIVLGKGFLSINNPDGSVEINNDELLDFIPQTQHIREDEEFDYEPEYFYRSPRFKRNVDKKTIKIDSPPNSPVGEEMPMILVLGPSVTMGIASMATAAFALNNALTNDNIAGALPSLVMSFSMMAGTLLWPTISKKFERKRKQKKEAYRQYKYRRYLKETEEQIGSMCVDESNILNENFITVNECVDRINNTDRRLWERSSGQDDYLRIRVGTGTGLLTADIQHQEKRFTLNDDDLLECMYDLAEKPKKLNNIPITFSLYDDYISGVIGEKEYLIDFCKGLVIQLSSFYSYDEVKMMFIYDESDEEKMNFVKWLPHVWSNDRKFRFIAKNINEIKEISSYIESEIEMRSELREQEIEDVSPYYIIFSLSDKLSKKADFLRKIYTNKENIHMSVISFRDMLKNLPKECSMIVEIDGVKGKLYDKDDISGKFVEFFPDICFNNDIEIVTKKLSNILLDNPDNASKLPNMISFLEMFDVGKTEHLNLLSRWKENDPTKSLETPVGVDSYGELFKLDLHEKYHGPHGLVAGMTGSGKSEFIITYILSLAVNYHPEEVAFILIDYKGGGMAKSFKNLPHTAGIITNLDGAAIKRSIVSIESELKRRQAVFLETGERFGISNIDIYKYQKLYREGKVKEPLQHLFIISDEFAELKTQQPEFMTQLVSAARIGRSLGIHLILATQKPSGVVDDQIWSNSKFKVCLKVQERADSMDMLKRPDAAELVETGRFYLQVGYNEIFEIGQSAWAGASYVPSEKFEKEKDDYVEVIDTNGRVLNRGRMNKKVYSLGNNTKQLDAITEYIRKIADEEKICIRPLWLEPLSENINIEELYNKYNIETEKYVINPVIGEYDDPSRQRQDVLTLPISKEGNVVIYGSSGSGKTTLLNTMLYSIINSHLPEEVNVYILDFSAETLTSFRNAPQVGDVCVSYEQEKINNLFKMLYKQMSNRKKMFSGFGGDYASYINNNSNKLPSIIVVINNYTAFTEMYEDKEEAIVQLTREGAKYGIYFVLTSISTNGVRFRLLQNFKQILSLQLNDETEYASVVGKTDGLYPSKFKGRGLVKLDKEGVFEFQTASVGDGDNSFMKIAEICNNVKKKYAESVKADSIPILPEIVDVKLLSEFVSVKNGLCVPIGIETKSLARNYLNFDKSYISMVYSMGKNYNKYLCSLAKLMSQNHLADVTIVDALNNCDGYASDLGKVDIVSTQYDIESYVSSTYDEILRRNKQYKSAQNPEEVAKSFDKKVIIINSINALKSMLSDENQDREKLVTFLEKGIVKYNVFFIIGESIGNLSGISYDKWYKENVSNNTAVWIGNGITEQYQLKITKTTPEMREDITDNFGYNVVEGKAVKIKLLNDYLEVGNDE